MLQFIVDHQNKMSCVSDLMVSEKTKTYVNLITEVLQAISLAKLKLKLKKENDIVEDLQKSEEQLKWIWVDLMSSSLTFYVLKNAVDNATEISSNDLSGVINSQNAETPEKPSCIGLLVDGTSKREDDIND